MEEELKKISWLKNCTLVSETRGHSRIPSFIVYDDDRKFFLKCYSGDQQQNLQTIEAQYRETYTPTALIRKLDYLPDTKLTLCLYEYIDGPNLEEALSRLSRTELVSLGEKVGIILQRLGRLDGRTLSNDLQTEVDQLWWSFYQQKDFYEQNSVNRPLPNIDLEHLEQTFAGLMKIVLGAPTIFAHTDINLSNIILHNDEPVVIDTSESRTGFRATNFRGLCWWTWDANDPDLGRRQVFYQALFRGLFANQIPDSWHQELAFAVLYEFLIRVRKYNHNSEQFYFSFSHWQKILEQTNYFENYRFWFN